MKNLKKKLLLILTALLLIAAALWTTFYFVNRDERLLRAMVGELETMVAKRPGKSNMLSMLDAATPERVFAENVTVISDQPKFKQKISLKDLSQLFLTIKKSCVSAELNVEIQKISIDSGEAEITGCAVFSGNASRSGNFREVREVKFTCIKTDGQWKISAAKIETVIKK